MDAALCAHGTQTLTEENAGTRWPKVTLGVLEEGVVMEERDARRLLSAVDDLNKELLSKCYAEERLDALDIVLFDVSFILILFKVHRLIFPYRNALRSLD